MGHVRRRHPVAAHEARPARGAGCGPAPRCVAGRAPPRHGHRALQPGVIRRSSPATHRSPAGAPHSPGCGP
jgi:hypothetical protein